MKSFNAEAQRRVTAAQAGLAIRSEPSRANASAESTQRFLWLPAAGVSTQESGVRSQELEFIPCIRCIPWFISTTNSIFAAAPTRNEQTQNFGVLSFINRSSSTIVFNQQHKCVAHRTPTPCEKIYPTFHSSNPTYPSQDP